MFKINMSESNPIKDASSVGSIAALGAVGLSTAYFYNRIGKIEEELAQMRTHLATVIQAVDPQNKLKMDQVVAAIRTLDGRVAKAQKELQTMAEFEPKPVNEVKPYQRLTRPAKLHRTTERTTDKPRSTDHVRHRTVPRAASSDESDSESKTESDYDDSQSESEDVSGDLEEAIAAMQ